MDGRIMNENTSNFIHDFIDEDLAEGGAYAGKKIPTIA